MSTTKKPAAKKPKTGRPRIAKKRRRVACNTRVAPETLREIKRQAREHGLSLGAVIDRWAGAQNTGC